MRKTILSLLLTFIAASAWAFNDFPTVQSLPSDLNSKTAYMLISARGALYADLSVEANSLTSNCQTGRNQNVANTKEDPRFQFLLFKAKGETNGYYVYSVQAKKFIAQSGVRAGYFDSPAVVYIYKHGGSGSNVDNAYGKKYNVADYPWIIASEETYGPYNSINVCCWEAANPDYRWCSTNGLDGGNEYSIAECTTVDEATWKAPYDKIVEFEKNQGAGGSEELDESNVLSESERATQTEKALDIINRFTKNSMEVEVILDLCRTKSGCDRYTYSATGSKLTIHASCAIAATRGFYDYVKAKGAGFSGWSGSRFEKPADMSCEETSLICQWRDHQYFNVVTYGYTVPYWNEERWDKEIDWMALHGVDMPLMLVGSEYIYRLVFKEMGLTDAEIDAWEVGPAHLPWFRMGNLSGNSFDGPLGDEWHQKQKALAHHLLDRMRALGMKPVCPAFGGFVPGAFSSRVAGATTETTGWDWCQPGRRNVPNYRLNPGSDAFVQVGKRFIELWEKEYGPSKYYLSDSFNEMTIPSDLNVLTKYGDNIYKCINEGSKYPGGAVWVTQGWTFVFQSGQWGNSKFQALTKNVPDDRFMVLYMSPEYGPNKCWEQYNGFNGKQWNYTMLPNMGGKTFWTGNFNNYAKTYLTNLYNSPSKGNCTGFGMTPEGVENNEMLYELITDAGWTSTKATINLDQWFDQYAHARYGSYTQKMKDIHQVLRQTVYNKYIDHPRFGWQIGGNLVGSGSASLAAQFYTGVESLFSDAEALKAFNNPTTEAELIELACLYVSGKIEGLAAQINGTNDKNQVTSMIAELDELMLDMDAALGLNPAYTLKHWEDQAQAMADKAETKQRNARNARRIVTVWFGNHTTDEPVQDYAARVWSGLVRDFYRPRLINQLKANKGLMTGWNRINFENQFVNSAPSLTPVREVTGDHIDFLVRLVNHAKNFGNIKAEPLTEIAPSTDRANHWYTLRNADEAESTKVLQSNGDNTQPTLAEDVKEGPQMWRVIATGDQTYRIENRWGESVSIAADKAMTYLAPVKANVSFSWNGTQLTITPAAKANALPAQKWQVEATALALVPEAKSEDYARYVRRVAGFTQTAHFGKPGFPKSEEDQTAAIVALQKEAQNIDHKTYDTFLYQWADIYEEHFTPASKATEQLVNLIMSAHQIIVPADAEKGGAAATLFAAIQAAENAVAAGTDAAAATTTLEAAVLAYYAAGGTVTTTVIEDIVPPTVSFPYTSPAPVNGQWDTESVAYYMKNDKDAGFWVSTAAAYCDGENLKVSNGTQPTDEAGRWVICGNDKIGYTFYNVAAGATKVLGITGTEGTARAKMYTIGETGDAKTAFKVSKNQSGFAFYFDTNNAWNNRSGYLALWEHANALTSDNGSRFVFVEAGKVVLSPEELELQGKFNELRETAQTKYDSNEGVTTEGENIITDPTWFSSNATETREGDITKLLDGDCTTYWHSNWATNVPAHTHYLQVTLPEAIEGDIQLTMGRRINKGSFCADDNPVEMSVEASADGTNFAEAIRFLTPFTQTVAQPYVKAVFTLEEPASVLRFFNEKSNSSNQRGYWHCGEFQLNKVTYTEGVNDKFAEAAEALKQALDAAKAVVTPTQEDYETLLDAYNAYLAAIGETEGINGTTITLLPSATFDLTGRRVSKSTRGLLIQNGRKVIK